MITPETEQLPEPRTVRELLDAIPSKENNFDTGLFQVCETAEVLDKISGQITTVQQGEIVRITWAHSEKDFYSVTRTVVAEPPVYVAKTQKFRAHEVLPIPPVTEASDGSELKMWSENVQKIVGLTRENVDFLLQRLLDLQPLKSPELASWVDDLQQVLRLNRQKLHFLLASIFGGPETDGAEFTRIDRLAKGYGAEPEQQQLLQKGSALFYEKFGTERHVRTHMGHIGDLKFNIDIQPILQEGLAFTIELQDGIHTPQMHWMTDREQGPFLENLKGLQYFLDYFKQQHPEELLHYLMENIVVDL